MTAPLPGLEADRSLARWLRLARKELREILRDRRTILTLVLMPLLLYPLLGIGLSYLYGGRGKEAKDGTEYHVGFDNDADGHRFRGLFNLGQEVWTRQSQDEVPAAGQDSDLSPDLIPYSGSDLDDHLRRGQLDLVIRVKRPQDDRTRLREWPIEFEITYDPDSSPSKEALRFVQSRLVAANVSLHEEALHRAGADALIRPVRVRSKGLVHEARKRGFLLAVLVPLVLILMTMTGAVYPAIDLTAGERERGTLEMLMATPVSRVALLAAKYVAVVVVASLTALMNLLMMTLTFFLVGGWMNVGGGLGLSLDMIPVVLLLVVLFAAFYAAVLLVLSSFARSFKEAQAYVIPLTLVSLVPGLLALMPNLQLGYGLALVPLLNIVLLARDLLSGSGGIGLTLVIIVATVVYGYIALVLASRTFGAEAVLYADSRSWWNFLRGRM